MAHMKRWLDQRRESAAQRKLEREKLSDQDQLDKLDEILGKGKGAVRERAKLSDSIKAAESKGK